MFRKLTENIGYRELLRHLGSVTMLMKMSPDYASFKKLLDQFHPRYGETLMLPFEEPKSGL
jgi:hypothetical protein